MSDLDDRLQSVASSQRRRVAVFRGPLLSLSETFVRDQILGLRRWDATLVGETVIQPRLSLDIVRYRVLYDAGLLGRLIRRVDRPIERLTGRSVALKRTLRAIDPALVHVHFGTDAVRVWPTIARTSMPMLVTLHGFDIHTRPEWWRSGQGGDFFRDYPERLVAMSADPRVQFVAVSEAVRRAAIAYGLPPERLHVRHIGVDTSTIRPGPTAVSERGRNVLFVGRLVEKKGAIFLIRAAARIASQVPGLRLTMVGDGPQRAELEQAARDLKVDALFLGAQQHDAVLRQFADARAFCLPSVTAENGDAEGLPIVLLEAQASGVPTVASATAAREEAIDDGVSGFAFAERDVDALALHLRTILLDDARCDAMSASAVAFARRRFDMADCTRRLEAMYDDVADGRPPRPTRVTE